VFNGIHFPDLEMGSGAPSNAVGGFTFGNNGGNVSACVCVCVSAVCVCVCVCVCVVFYDIVVLRCSSTVESHNNGCEGQPALHTVLPDALQQSGREVDVQVTPENYCVSCLTQHEQTHNAC